MIPEPGLNITGTIQLRRGLAKGGMGSIWMAEDLSLRRQVAVKLMSDDLAGNVAAHARFELEAQTNARIRSKHVPRIYDYGRTPDGTPYIVMELLQGMDLEERIRKSGRLSIHETLRIVNEIGSALAEAHAQGIVHRDVKAENVFLAQSGKSFSSKLLDFGVAKVTFGRTTPHLTCAGGTLGTPGYISAEQLVAPSKADERSDVWSFGVVIYLCLTGKLPFAGETFAAICLAVDRGTFVPASELNTALPPSIDAWFARALHRSPAGRFATMREMILTFRAATQRPSAWELVTGRPAYTRLTESCLEPPRPRKRAKLAVAVSIAAAAAALTSLEPAWASQLVVQARSLKEKALSTLSHDAASTLGTGSIDGTVGPFLTTGGPKNNSSASSGPRDVDTAR